MAYISHIIDQNIPNGIEDHYNLINAMRNVAYLFIEHMIVMVISGVLLLMLAFSACCCMQHKLTSFLITATWSYILINLVQIKAIIEIIIMYFQYENNNAFGNFNDNRAKEQLELYFMITIIPCITSIIIIFKFVKSYISDLIHRYIENRNLHEAYIVL